MNEIGSIVRATAGRDKERLFCIIGVENEDFVLISDGKTRKMAHFKRKKKRHLELLSDKAHPFRHPVIEKLMQGNPVTDRDLRRALAAFKEGNTLG